MRRILTSVLTLSWATIFGLLAVGVLPSGAGSALDMLGLDRVAIAGATTSAGLVAYLLALFCLSASVLFVWAFAVSLFGHGPDIEGGDDVNRVAFAAGAGALTLGLLAGALSLVSGLFVIAMASLAALIASYVATFLERLSLLMSSQPAAGDVRAAARLMALGVAHGSLLSSISSRESPNRSGSR